MGYIGRGSRARAFQLCRARTVEFDIVSSDLRPLFRIQRVGDARSGRALVLACEPGVRGVDWRPIGEIVVRSTYVPSADCKVAYTAYEIDDLGAHIEPMATVGADLFTQKFRFFQEGAQVAGLQHVPGRWVGCADPGTSARRARRPTTCLGWSRGLTGVRSGFLSAFGAAMRCATECVSQHH